MLRGSEHDELRAAAGWGLMEYYTCLDASGRYFTPEMLRRVQQAVLVFLNSYKALAAESIAKRSPAWHMVPKHHMMEHIGDTMAPQVNPAKVGTLSGEALGLCFRVPRFAFVLCPT